MESIGSIIKRKLTREETRKLKLEVLEGFLKERAELELQAIRTDLAATGNNRALVSEMAWAKDDMLALRTPEFLKPLFKDHYEKCYKLWEPITASAIPAPPPDPGRSEDVIKQF